MPENAKQDAIEAAGFTYWDDRDVYINTKAKKIVAREDVDDRSEEWLRKVIADPNDSGKWRFCFSTPPTDLIRKALLAALE